tara:strand:+ start:106 stop:420 length:315 start_codon:yes stop_codon:yes gene_type:complete
MTKIKFILFLIFTLLILQSCQAVKDGLTSQKKKSTDEFLVEKKSPLVMPPEFDKLPLPTTAEESNFGKNNNNIEKLISENNSEEKIETQNKNFENSIIEKIKQN